MEPPAPPPDATYVAVVPALPFAVIVPFAVMIPVVWMRTMPPPAPPSAPPACPDEAPYNAGAIAES